MPKYIPCEKMKKLREAVKNGDEMARKILMAQLNDEDFSCDLDTYFQPKEEPKLIEEVANEPIEKQEETEAIQSQIPVITGKPTPSDNEISQGILSVINSCDKKTLEIANDEELSDATKKGALSILQEIKQSSLDCLEKFGKLMSSIAKKVVEE